MSGKPSDPFGRSDRTVIQPNPGGRRPTPGGRPLQQPVQPIQAPDDWSVPGSPAPQVSPAYQPPPQAAPAYAPASYGAPPPYQPQPSQPAPLPGLGPVGQPLGAQAMVLKRDVPIAPNENVMIEAAGPVLLLLGRLRASLMHARFSNLMDQMAEAIDGFDKELRANSVTQEMATEAKYIVCATADDIVQHIPSEDRHVWTQYSMLSRFFGERIGGVKFFEKLDKAKQDPVVNYDLLELMYACLALGFQGRYRTEGSGVVTLQTIQRNLYETLRRVRPRTSLDLSPNWPGQEMPAVTSTFKVPMWSIAAVATALLGILYLTLRFLLGGNAETVAEEVGRLVPSQQVSLLRPLPVVPPPPPPARPRSSQLDCLRIALAEEIASGAVSLEENANSIILRVAGFASFASGRAEILDTFQGAGRKIAAALDKQPGNIRVIGHTDSDKISNSRFPSNFHLSVERANAVARLFRPGLSQPDRLEIEGKGPDQPVASNETAAGKARNRRVDVIVPRNPLQTSCP
jgi:type VI secretion system protein ImpK